MKKMLLTAATALISLAVGAQERLMTVSNSPQGTTVDYNSIKSAIKEKKGSSDLAYKTTADPRWFSYIDWFDQYETDFSSSIAFAAPYLWKDTMAVMAYSSTGGGTTWEHNTMVSMGLSIDPAFSGFNGFYYDGQMEVKSSDAFTVDSIRFFGRYGYNVANTYVDTLRVAFVYGDGGTTADVYEATSTNPAVLTKYGVTGGLTNYRMKFDTVTTTAGGPTRITTDIILDNTGSSPAWGDTLSNGLYMGRIGFPDVNVPAGNMIGATITFISGSPSFTPHDTVFGSAIGYKHNMFRPYVAHKGAVNAPVLNTYDAANKNSGMFKTLPDTALGWGGQYIPLWYWSGSGAGSASTLQYPYIDFHIKCPTCGLVNVGVNDVANIVSLGDAYPNPAHNAVNIPFTLSKQGNASVALYNVLGKLVELQDFTNIQSETATFETDKLSPGMYIYTVESDGVKRTRRIAISH